MLTGHKKLQFATHLSEYYERNKSTDSHVATFMLSFIDDTLVTISTHRAKFDAECFVSDSIVT